MDDFSFHMVRVVKLKSKEFNWTKQTLRGTLKETGPVRDAQKSRQCVYIIPCGCVNVPWAKQADFCKYALRSTDTIWRNVGWRNESQPNMSMKSNTKYKHVGKKQRFYEPNTIYRKHTSLGQHIRSSFPSGLSSWKRKSASYISVQVNTRWECSNFGSHRTSSSLCFASIFIQ
jgi:hypothetical protein